MVGLKAHWHTWSVIAPYLIFTEWGRGPHFRRNSWRAPMQKPSPKMTLARPVMMPRPSGNRLHGLLDNPPAIVR